MKKLFRWFLLLNKRLYKKPAFIAILAIIPICILAFRVAAESDSGFLNIALAQENKSDKVSSNVINDLISEDSLIRYTVYDSHEEAIRAVTSGKADAAWLFPDKLNEKLTSFAEDHFNDEFIRIIERESNVFLRLSHEKLSAELYKYSAQAFFISYTRQELEDIDALSDEELIAYFDNISITEDLFTFENPATSTGSSKDAFNYLLSPVRGLLSVLIVLCGMAAAMFCIQDEQSGTFSWIPDRKKIYVSFACIFIAVLNISVIVFLSLIISGLAGNILIEFPAMLLYSICCSLFCLLLKYIIPNLRAYASVIPLMMVVMIGVCPVFFGLKIFNTLNLIFPPTYYIHCPHRIVYLLLMFVYVIVLAALCFGADILSRRPKKI